MNGSILRSLKALGLALALVAFAIPAAVAQKKDRIVIGVAGPYTGSSASLGKQMLYGAKAAAKEVNDAGGLLGKKIAIVEQDDEGSASTANQVAQKLTADRELVAVIGHFNSDCSTAAKGTYSDAGIVMFSPGSTNPAVTENTEYVFRNIFNDRSQGHSLAEYVKNTLKKSRVAVLYENDTYGRGLREYYMEKAKELGLETVADISYQREQTDFRPLLTQIRDAKPEVILACGLYKAGGTIALQARELGLQQPIIGGDGMYAQELVSIAGKAAEGFICTCPFILDEKEVRTIKLKKLVMEVGNVEADAWAALGYDAAHQVFEAIKRAGKADRQALRDQLAAMNTAEKGYAGITGTTYFDERGDTKKPISVAIVKDGKFVRAE